MRVLRGIAASTCVLIAAGLYGQSDLQLKSFEVASVKRFTQPSPSVSRGGGPGTPDPGRWLRSNVSLMSLLVEAFQIQGYALIGPDWLRSERYEIVATVPAGTKRDDIPAMVQRLIVERFGLKFHREEREVAGYGLVVGKNGPKLKPSTGMLSPIPARNGFASRPEGIAPGVIDVESAGSVRRLSAGAMSMAQLADYLSAQIDSPVIDATELRDKYDVVLYFSKPLPVSASPQGSAENAFDLPAALREQLGLELRARKVRANLLVIDHIDPTPTAN